MYSISRCGERYEGQFETREGAIAEAPSHFGLTEPTRFYVGRMVKPKLTDHIHVMGMLERAFESDEWCGEWHEDYIGDVLTSDHIDELTDGICSVINGWLQTHGLDEVPSWNIEDPEEHHWEPDQPTPPAPR